MAITDKTSILGTAYNVGDIKNMYKNFNKLKAGITGAVVIGWAAVDFYEGTKQAKNLGETLREMTTSEKIDTVTSLMSGTASVMYGAGVNKQITSKLHGAATLIDITSTAKSSLDIFTEMNDMMEETTGQDLGLNNMKEQMGDMVSTAFPNLSGIVSSIQNAVSTTEDIVDAGPDMVSEEKLGSTIDGSINDTMLSSYDHTVADAIHAAATEVTSGSVNALSKELTYLGPGATSDQDEVTDILGGLKSDNWVSLDRNKVKEVYYEVQDKGVEASEGNEGTDGVADIISLLERAGAKKLSGEEKKAAFLTDDYMSEIEALCRDSDATDTNSALLAIGNAASMIISAIPMAVGGGSAIGGVAASVATGTVNPTAVAVSAAAAAVGFAATTAIEMNYISKINKGVEEINKGTDPQTVCDRVMADMNLAADAATIKSKTSAASKLWADLTVANLNVKYANKKLDEYRKTARGMYARDH